MTSNSSDSESDEDMRAIDNYKGSDDEIDDEIGWSNDEDMLAIDNYRDSDDDIGSSNQEVAKPSSTVEEDVVEVVMLSSDDEDVNNPIENYSDLYSSRENENVLETLIAMGYSKDDALMAMETWGEDGEIADLIDYICAAQFVRENADQIHSTQGEGHVGESSKAGKGKRESGTSRGKKQKPSSIDYDDEDPIRLPQLMTGFGVLNEPAGQFRYRLHELARLPPYFYYENVGITPKGVWDVISSHLYEVKPEFVDSRYFCAAARKRGYIHNLPIRNRFPVEPHPKCTIQEALPFTKRWWPSWDTRVQLNCLRTCVANPAVIKRIHNVLQAHHEGDPPEHVQQYVMRECRKWNLVWVGKKQVAPLTLAQVENLLGFPRDHTKGDGRISRTARYKALGNSFQVETVAYHLSVLKELFPNGINVLSLFSGIGGAEMALYRLGIKMNVVVSIEISKDNQKIMKSFWRRTKQKGKLKHYDDVQKLKPDKIATLMDKYGGFDLVIGGSPCNNLTGSNRVSRTGLEGKDSSLFFEYVRILNTVREKAARMRR